MTALEAPSDVRCIGPLGQGCGHPAIVADLCTECARSAVGIGLDALALDAHGLCDLVDALSPGEADVVQQLADLATRAARAMPS